MSSTIVLTDLHVQLLQAMDLLEDLSINEKARSQSQVRAMNKLTRALLEVQSRETGEVLYPEKITVTSEPVGLRREDLGASLRRSSLHIQLTHSGGNSGFAFNLPPEVFWSRDPVETFQQFERDCRLEDLHLALDKAEKQASTIRSQIASLTRKAKP